MIDRIVPLNPIYIYAWATLVAGGFAVVMLDAISRNDFRTAGWAFSLIVVHTAASPLIVVGITEPTDD